jgi:hypothetical protein
MHLRPGLLPRVHFSDIFRAENLHDCGQPIKSNRTNNGLHDLESLGTERSGMVVEKEHHHAGGVGVAG